MRTDVIAHKLLVHANKGLKHKFFPEHSAEYLAKLQDKGFDLNDQQKLHKSWKHLMLTIILSLFLSK